MYNIENFVGSIKSAVNSKKEKIIVLDVEGYSTVRPYNIGYIVADLYGKVYRKRSFALPSCIWENIKSMLYSRQAEEMTKKNVEEILKDYEKPKLKRKYKFISPEHFSKIFTADINTFKVKRVFAYNVNFDKGSLKRVMGDEIFNKLTVEFCDIITGIVETKLLSKNYINFCIENGFLTEKGNIMTKAEVVIKYLTKDMSYVEEHTGLADVMDEYFILLCALNTHKKINNWKPCMAWKLLKEYAMEHNIKLE